MFRLLDVTVVLTLSQPAWLFAADFWKAKPPGEWTESEASRMLNRSPWAKRTKLRVGINTATNRPPAPPRTQEMHVGLRGPDGTMLSPSRTEIFNPFGLSSKPIPCLGWGVGIGRDPGNPYLALPSPTSDECRAAWKSVSAAKSAGLPKDSVIVLWESARPVLDAKARLAINDPVNTRAADSVIVSLVGYPLMVDPAQSVMKPIIRDSAVLLKKRQNAVRAFDVAFIESNESIIRFFFSRQEANPAGSTEVVFRFQMSTTLVEAKFELREMVYQGGPAL